MKKRASIGIGNMASLFFVYLTGSSLIMIPGPLVAFAKNASWLSLLLSMTIGIGLLAIMLYLRGKYPERSFIAMCRTTIGKWPTVVIACLMLPLAFHMASGIMIDVSAFMTSMLLPETPAYVFSGMLYIVAALFLRSGIEAIGRMTALLGAAIVIMWVIVIAMLVSDLRPELLQPVFPDGIKPMLLGSYTTLGFPYGEVVLLLVVLPFARQDNRKKLRIALIGTMIANGAVLTISTLSTMMILGPLAPEKKYSLFVLSQTIELGDIIERMEAVVGMSMIAGSVMKAIVTLFAIQTILSDLLGCKDGSLLANPLCLLCQLMVIAFPPTFKTWEEIVLVVHPLWVASCYIMPLLIIAAVALWKNAVSRANRGLPPT